MREVLQELKHLRSGQIENLAKLAKQFAYSLERLAETTRKQEQLENDAGVKKLRKSELKRFKKLEIQRLIMKRYLEGQSYEQIGASTGYHPKTIYQMIRKYQYDLSILHKIDYDLEKYKISEAKKMLLNGQTKPDIVKRLNLSAHSVTAVAYMNKISLPSKSNHQ